MKKLFIPIFLLLTIGISTSKADVNSEIELSVQTTERRDATKLESQRPVVSERLFKSDAVEKKIRVVNQLKTHLAWMLENRFKHAGHHHTRVIDGEDDTFV